MDWHFNTMYSRLPFSRVTVETIGEIVGHGSYGRVLLVVPVNDCMSLVGVMCVCDM